MRKNRPKMAKITKWLYFGYRDETETFCIFWHLLLNDMNMIKYWKLSKVIRNASVCTSNAFLKKAFFICAIETARRHERDREISTAICTNRDR